MIVSFNIAESLELVGNQEQQQVAVEVVAVQRLINQDAVATRMLPEVLARQILEKLPEEVGTFQYSLNHPNIVANRASRNQYPERWDAQKAFEWGILGYPADIREDIKKKLKGEVGEIS